ncbi:zinc finger, CCHC-type containing protein, partial [Tanacetum coccineum]
EGSRDEIGIQYSYCYSIEEDPKTLDEAMQSRYKPLGCKWIFKRKMKVDGTIDKFKARLVIQGFRQKEVIDYFDTYAHVARISTIRLLIALAAIYNLVIHQMDVKTTFLNGDLEEDVYMKQPKQFIMPRNEHKVCKLSKSLYGLKQAPKQWHQNLTRTDQDQVDKTKEFLSSNFSMKDMGKADVILGRAVDQLEYSRVIGCLLYAMTSTRPDVAYGVGKLSRYTSNPSTYHWHAIMRITNSEDHTSTTGWVFLLGGCAISWASKKQTCITDSTMEVEFVALAAAGKEAEWLRNLIYEILLWPKLISSISINCDSAATLAKAYSQIYTGKSRHLGVRHNMVPELITNGVISVNFVRSQQNLADHLTKGLARDLVHKSAIGMGLKSIKISNDETPNSLIANARS